MQHAEAVDRPENHVRIVAERRLRRRHGGLAVLARADQVYGHQAAPALQPDHPRRRVQPLSIRPRPRRRAERHPRRRREVQIHGDQGSGALDPKVQTGIHEEFAGPTRLFLGVPTGLDRRRAGDRRNAGRQPGQYLRDGGTGRHQAGFALPCPDQAQGWPLTLARFGGDHDLDLLSDRQPVLAAERQKAV